MTYDFDLIVLGGGAAGLTASGIGANLGVKTLMIERERHTVPDGAHPAKLGGDCTWTGCVPSKALLKAAKVAHQLRHAADYGLVTTAPEVDFKRVMDHVRHIRDDVFEEADRPEIYEDMGIEVRVGTARFTDAHTVAIEADGTAELVTGRFIIIATGGRALVPPIAGLDTVPYLTNHSLFEQDQQPKRLAVVGAGPIGTEMAQAFQRLGTQVTVLDMAPGILGKDDAELTALLRERLEEEGIQYMLGAAVERVDPHEGGVRVTAQMDGQTRTVDADALLLATGRRPNIEGLGLEEAGVAFTRRGITVDDRGKTSQSHIYAAGDVTGQFQFTHMSEHTAKVAATSLILKVPTKVDTAHVPWVTYTDPELAHVGATEAQLKEKGERYEVYRFPYAKVDRAITDGDTIGLIKVFATSLTGTILGASILGAHAGDLIGAYALAMRNGISLRQISDTIHPYPTYGLGVRRAADQWYARKQSVTFTRFLQTVFRYRGPVIEPDPDRIV